MKDYILKFNIKSIIHFEKLARKAFSRLDYSDYKDILRLIYCCYYCNNEDFTYTYDAFEKVILNNQKLSQKVLKQFHKTVELQEQFSTKQEVSDEPSLEVHQEAELFIYKIIPILTANCGLDINYILNEMSLEDVGSYINNYNSTKQEELQLQRLWCYYSILPHVGKKLKSPKDLILFNWEKDEEAIRSKSIADEYKDKLEDILKNAKL